MRVTLGTMTIGDVSDEERASKMIELWSSLGEVSKPELDTASMYPSGGEMEGCTESILGRVIKDKSKFSLATKANPASKHEGLTPASVRRQLCESLQRLGVKRVQIFYLHWPDHETPLAQTLHEVQKLYEEGKFLELGLSNYSAWQVTEVVWQMKSRGWVVPTVYQGMYNCLTRTVEPELLPCLRHHNMRFYAYNATCGGFVSCRDDSARFTVSLHAPRYRLRYLNDDYRAAVAAMAQACQEEGIDPIDAALRWLTHHSHLSAAKGDTIVVGASKAEHVESNMKSIREGKPLPKKLVDAIDNAAAMAKPSWQNYHR